MPEETKKLDLSGDGGVLKEILKEGSGTETPHNGCKVSLHYTGRLVDGTEFDSSVSRNEPFEFDLGKGRVIKGFDIGIATMKLGERCFLTCAPNYAYGSAEQSNIPAESTLIFELEMLGWKGEDLSPNQDGSIERTILEQSDKNRTPKDGAYVKAHISGTFGGSVFEERDVEFDFGEGSAIGIVEGLEHAMETMNIGEKSKIKIQSKYAFGDKGNEAFKIPPNSTIEYTVKLIDCGKGLQEWKLSDNERVSEAKVYKDKGTNYFKKENYVLAIKMYNKCKNLLPSLKDNTSEEVKALKVASHSNIALCHQKCFDHFEAKQECNSVLELDANNVKALYRRGQSNLVINELLDALKDFQKVIELEPTNKAAANHVVICNQKIKENKDKEKKLYSKMFSKLAAGGNETEPLRETDVLDKCGEWSEEDAKREADLTLERDNIIMI